ncbi:MAG: Rieske (2Fe-2S) protein [Deltaproteobacteria bacterium]|nr:Rieske (2Fe-2S) protein [Deltaproteobacteria bacterium]
MERRRFLNLFLTLLGLTTVGSFVYPLVRFLAPAGRKADVKQITLKKSEIPVGTAKEIPLNNIPAIIINRPDKGFVALSRVCTHLGCLVEYYKIQNKLICPCHGALFDLEGNVVSGPPPRPLLKFPIKVESESILIG